MNKRILATVSVLFVGCSETTPEAPPPSMGPVAIPREKITETPQPGMPSTHPTMAGLDVLSRGPRRLSVAQLEKSLDAIGGLPPGTVQIPDSLAVSIGEPDYVARNEESLDASPLFMKFMVDLGGFLCTSLSDAEENRPIDQRVMTRFSTTEENVRHMLLLFTGIQGAQADEYVARLLVVHAAGANATTRRDRGGEEAVCLALVTSPEFLLY